MRAISKQLGARTGMSLMELLIALSLLAVISAGIVTSLGYSLHIFDRSHQLGASSQAIAHRIQLRTWLSQAMPPSARDMFPTTFDGAPAKITFVTQAETPFFPEAAALRVTITAEKDKLTFSATAIQFDGQVMRVFEGVLAEDAQDIRIDYLSTSDDGPGWNNAWSEDRGLPVAVRIVMSPGSTPDWPDFAVHPIYHHPSQ